MYFSKFIKIIVSFLMSLMCVFLMPTSFSIITFASEDTVIYIEGTNPISNRTLNSGTYVLTDNTSFVDTDNTIGDSGLIIEDDAIVYIYIPQGLTLTATGIAGSGITGGGAGIYLPSSSTLYLIGKGTVIANGGNASDGELGSDASDSCWSGDNEITSSGKGGAGGGGAGAGIGTSGGQGGLGGASVGENRYVNSNEVRDGLDGKKGNDGDQALDSGTLYVSGINLQATGGEAGESLHDKSNNGLNSYKTWSKRYSIGSNGGGGNGAGGRQGNNIGSGGSGGAGGGSGGTGGTTYSNGSAIYNPAGGHGGDADGDTNRTNGSIDRYNDPEGGDGGSGGTTIANLPAKDAIELSSTANNIKTNITFDNQDGTGIDSIVLYMGSTGENNATGSTITIPTRIGHSFCGYYTGINGTGIMIYDAFGKLKNPDGKTILDGKWVRSASSEAKSLVLYAYWQSINCNIVISNDGNGSASASKTSAALNDTISLTAVPKIGYEFDYWEVISGGITITNNSFITSSCDSDIKIKAHFKEKTNYAVNCVNNNTGISEITLDNINKADAIKIAKGHTDIIDYINNKTKDVSIFIEASDITDKSFFKNKKIDVNNGLFVNLDLYIQASGEQKKKITDIDGYKVKINFTLNSDQANKFVGNNKNCYILRKHNNSIEKVDVQISKKGDNFVFSFSTDKFSSYVLYSDGSIANSSYKYLNTGID